ncbi:MAG: UrcA family protein [Pseudomonadota bacterium]
MRFSKTIIVPVVLAIATPQVAYAGEVVEFSLQKSELSTPKARELLLDRMTKFAMRNCRDSSVIAPRDAVARCAEDLRAQFVRAIDDDALTLLLDAQGRKTYRSASR